jgi:hypothetical protein
VAETHPILGRLLMRLYGDGLAGWAAAIVADRSIAALRGSTRKEPELLDVSRLRAGESYVVTTRPAPRRKEQQLLVASAKAHARLDKAERPSRRLRKAERRLRKAERRLARTRSGSRRERKAAGIVLGLSKQVDGLKVPSRKVRKRRAEVAAIDRELATRQDKVMARAHKRARPLRRRQFS